MNEQSVVPLLERLVEQQNEVLRELQSQRQELAQQRQELELQRDALDKKIRAGLPAVAAVPPVTVRKDSWDRLQAIAPIMSAFIIACIGAYFTYTYNLQQLKVQEIQTIERFIPHLTGDEKSKRAAILAINYLGNTALAVKVASIFASEGTASALQSIAEKSPSTADRHQLQDALAQTLDALAEKYKYENKFEDAVETYKRAVAIKEQTFGKDSPELIENLDKLAQMYELHGEHAEATAVLKRVAMLKGGPKQKGGETAEPTAPVAMDSEKNSVANPNAAQTAAELHRTPPATDSAKGPESLTSKSTDLPAETNNERTAKSTAAKPGLAEHQNRASQDRPARQNEENRSEVE